MKNAKKLILTVSLIGMNLVIMPKKSSADVEVITANQPAGSATVKTSKTTPPKKNIQLLSNKYLKEEQMVTNFQPGVYHPTSKKLVFKSQNGKKPLVYHNVIAVNNSMPLTTTKKEEIKNLIKVAKASGTTYGGTWNFYGNLA